jgi:alpha-beta hydrolase superfamily lysophospholipase
MPKDLPVLFVSGEEDPVGNYGKGVKKAYESFEKAGMKRISLKLYPGDRHELLNEKDREQVWEELLRFVEERIQEYEI